MVQILDPTSVADLVLRNILLIGFTCLLRPNSYQLLKWRHVTFTAEVDVGGNLQVEVVVVVPDTKSVAYAAAVGGLSRTVKLKEFTIRDLCGVRTLLVLANKMGVLERDLVDACLHKSFVVKPECLDWLFYEPLLVGYFHHIRP